MKRVAAASLTLVMLAGCANPQVAAPVGVTEGSMSCAQLQAEMQNARNLKAHARDEDRAKPSYLLVVPGVVSWYRMEKAEEAAQARMDELATLGRSKGCMGLSTAEQPNYSRVLGRNFMGSVTQAHVDGARIEPKAGFRESPQRVSLYR